MHKPLRRLAGRAIAAATLAATAALAVAHGSSVGALEISHPYATPSLAGTRHGAAYLRSIENKGAADDRLLRAATPVAARVELHTMNLDAQGVMRMREVEAIGIAAKQTLRMQPGAGFHLMLMELKQPLKDGDTFLLTLVFERAGSVDVKVFVQTPRAGAASAPHKH